MITGSSGISLIRGLLDDTVLYDGDVGGFGLYRLRGRRVAERAALAQ
jgi:hypothetical protein